jgi:hypothetical protein
MRMAAQATEWRGRPHWTSLDAAGRAVDSGRSFVVGELA